MPGRDGFGNLTFHLHAGVIGCHEFPSGRSTRFGHSQRGRKSGRGGMSQKPINAVLGHSQLRIVVIVRMDSNSIYERGKSRGNLHGRADYRGIPARDSERLHVCAAEVPAFGHGTAKCQAESVQDRLLAQVCDILRDAAVARIDNELGNFARQPANHGEFRSRAPGGGTLLRRSAREKHTRGRACRRHQLPSAQFHIGLAETVYTGGGWGLGPGGWADGRKGGPRVVIVCCLRQFGRLRTPSVHRLATAATHTPPRPADDTDDLELLVVIHLYIAK